MSEEMTLSGDLLAPVVGGFDCGVQGGDPSTTVGFLARTLRVHGEREAICASRRSILASSMVT